MFRIDRLMNLFCLTESLYNNRVRALTMGPVMRNCNGYNVKNYEGIHTGGKRELVGTTLGYLSFIFTLSLYQLDIVYKTFTNTCFYDEGFWCYFPYHGIVSLMMMA